MGNRHFPDAGGPGRKLNRIGINFPAGRFLLVKKFFQGRQQLFFDPRIIPRIVKPLEGHRPCRRRVPLEEVPYPCVVFRRKEWTVAIARKTTFWTIIAYLGYGVCVIDCISLTDGESGRVVGRIKTVGWGDEAGTSWSVPGDWLVAYDWRPKIPQKWWSRILHVD